VILAIDPGPAESACLLYDVEARRPVEWATLPNPELLAFLDRYKHRPKSWGTLAVEMVASYGMAVGAEVFDTCVWVGRFVERWGGDDHELIYRADVKLHLCHDKRAKDTNIRQALIDRYGPGKAAAVGLKASPGPLYGLTGDCWSALAVAVTVAETSA
jgi:hypothetical protein